MLFTRRKLKKSILKSGYYENFNDVDRQVRQNYDLEDFLKSCIKGSKKHLETLDPWLRSEVSKIILFDPKFENGNPHTHGRFIFLPYDFENRFKNIPVLIRHEAIHIWQRYHPCEASRYVILKYKCPISGFQKNTTSKSFRSNPDINRILYGDITNEFRPDAKKLTDILDVRDHPYEMMAYEESESKLI